MSARYSTREPRTLWTLPYKPRGVQAWCQEALGYDSVYKSITGRIFEFGFCDAFLQMIAAFCDQVERGPEAFCIILLRHARRDSRNARHPHGRSAIASQLCRCSAG